MSSRSRSDRTEEKQEAERYREAANLALEQLDWCINYLQRIGKGRIAAALRQNKTRIVERHRL